jgi:hypothetical protein
MSGNTNLKIRLTKNVRGYGKLFPQGEVLEAQVGFHGKVMIRVGIYLLPLDPDAWELILSDEDLEEWLAA